MTDATVGSAGGHPPADRRRRGPGADDRGATGLVTGRRRKGHRGLVPPADFQSYYGRPVLKPPVWEAADIAGYLFLGGLAGASALLGAGGDLTGRPALRRAGRTTALGGITLSFVALVHDLGRPERFLHMLRVIKPTSPMSVGTWILMAFGPAAGLAGAAEAAGWLPMPRSARPLLSAAGRPAGLASAAVAPLVMTYTAVLIADTAVPAWHDGYRELPYLFAVSSFAAAGGLATTLVPPRQSGPARALAVGGAGADLVLDRLLQRRLGPVGEVLHQGHAGVLMRAARWGNVAGAALIATAGRSRVPLAAGGAVLLASSACTRFGIFLAGVASASDPRHTIEPQRRRLSEGDGR